MLSALVAVFCAFTVAAGGQPLSSREQAIVAKAKRVDKNGWAFIRASGTPYELGFQQGYLLAGEIKEGIRVTRVGWEYESAMEWNWLVERACALMLARVPADILAEIDGLAAGLKAAGVSVSRNDLLTYNAYFELAWYWWPGELKKIKEGSQVPVRQSCSSFIATGSITRDGNVLC